MEYYLKLSHGVLPLKDGRELIGLQPLLNAKVKETTTGLNINTIDCKIIEQSENRTVVEVI